MLSWSFIRNSSVELEVREARSSHLKWGEQQVALAAPLVTTSDGGPGQRPVAQPEPPAIPPSKR